MEYDEAFDWISDIKQRVPFFIENLRGKTTRGFFHYTLSGDFRNTEDWGVFNSVCGARILYILNALSERDRNQIAEFILSFEHSDGTIIDPFFLEKYRICQVREVFTSLNINRFSSSKNEVIRATTRSAYSGLFYLNHIPKKNYPVPQSKSEVEKFIHKLNWNEPWGAGSHFSAMILFLVFYKMHSDQINQRRVEDLITHAFNLLDSLWNDGGFWGVHPERMPISQKINGCMKVLLAYQWAVKQPMHPESMIDLCLENVIGGDGCNNLDNILVLYECSKYRQYRHADIVAFCLERLDLYKEHWWENEGGFSFFGKHSIDHLYGAKIASSKPEPDIHGTWLHLYGISMIAHLCGMNEQFDLKIPLI